MDYLDNYYAMRSNIVAVYRNFLRLSNDAAGWPHDLDVVHLKTRKFKGFEGFQLEMGQFYGDKTISKWQGTKSGRK